MVSESFEPQAFTGLVPEWKAWTPPVAPTAPTAKRARARSAPFRWRRAYMRRLVVTDTVVVLLAGTAGTLIGTPSALWQSLGQVVVFAAVWLAALTAFRTRSTHVIGVGTREYKLVGDATLAVAGWLAILALVFQYAGVRDFLLFGLPLGVAGLIATRFACRRWLHATAQAGHSLFRVVLAGQEPDITYVAAQLRKNSWPVYEVVATVMEDPAQAAGAPGVDGAPVFVGLDRMKDAIVGHNADSVIIAGPLKAGAEFTRQLGWELERTDTELILAAALTNVAGPRIRMRPVEGLPLMHVELPTFSGGRHVVKRAIDVVSASLAIVLLSPLLAALFLAVWSEDRHPAIFSQWRVGHEGRRFRMYKLRTMCPDAEARLAELRRLNEGSGPMFKLREDPRVTRVGRWLRRFSLDELPQLFNILRGDMSLVGPRPPLPQEVEAYVGDTGRRLLIKPGLTGLWQVSGRSDLSWEESVRLDLYYVENWSVAFDLQILWRTAKVVLRPTGAY